MNKSLTQCNKIVIYIFAATLTKNNNKKIIL